MMIKLIGNPISYLHHYFNLFHCLLVCPYTFSFNRNYGTYKLRTHCCIQIFSFIITLFSFYNPVKKFYFSIFDQVMGVHPLINLLDLVKAGSECIYVFAITHTLWCKKAQLFDIVNYLQSPDLIFRTSFEPQNCKAKIYCSLIALIVAATVTLNTIELYDSWNVAVTNQQQLLNEAVTTILITSGTQMSITAAVPNRSDLFNASAVNDTISIDDYGPSPLTPAMESGILPNPNPDEISFYKIILVILYFFENNFVQLVYCFGDWLMIIISVVLSEAVNRFEQIVKDSNSTGKQVLDYYEALKLLSRKINDVFGLLVFAFTVTSIPLFVTSLLTVMNPKSPAVLMRDLIYFFNFFYFLFMAVFIDKKSTILEQWLLFPKNYAQLLPSQMTALLHEMKTREIGFHGLGLFKVSAGLLGMTINLILTFSIIFLQFNTTRSTTLEF